MAFVSKFKAANAGAANLSTGDRIENTSQNNRPFVKPQPQNQSTVHQKGRPMGGWDDGEYEPTLKGNNKPAVYISNNKTSTTPEKSPLSINTDNRIVEKPVRVVQPSQYDESYKKFEVLPWNDDFNEKHEYEVKVINELIQPGGARLRQPDITLNEFCKAAESLQVEVVGSILLHSLVSQIVWISKARAIFAIETLIKKHAKYYDFFKRNIRHLRRNEFENEGANATQLMKYIDEVINYLEDPEKAPEHYAQSATALHQNNGSQTTKTYSQSAVQSNSQGTLSAQLKSNSHLTSNDIEPVLESNSEVSSPDTKTQNIQEHSPEKAENIMDSLAGLNFSDEQKKVNEEKEKRDELYNLYNAALPNPMNPMQNIGGPMPYPNMSGPHGMNSYGPGPYNYPNHQGYPNTQFYRPQANPHYPQYNPNMYAHAGNGYSKPMNYPQHNNYPNQYNNGQYNLQRQQMNMGPTESIEDLIVNPEELKKKKQQEEIAKRFDSLNF